MVDTLDKEARSLVMSRVRSTKNISTEIKLMGVFKELGVKGWRRGSKITGKPDFVFPKIKIAVFADGCFWHGHKCRDRIRIPKSNVDFWATKIARNKQRDREVSKDLRSKGWSVLRIRECELKKKNRSLLLRKLKPLHPFLKTSLKQEQTRL